MSDLAQLKSSNSNLFVVSIGASAGGSNALAEFFEHLAPSDRTAYVVIQHLAPDSKSLMKELLAKHTELPIYLVTHEMALQPNAVYLIPPGQNLVLEGNLLRLKARPAKNSQQHQLNFPIDLFFISLAQNYEANAIGIVLSGSGSDGTRGLRAISAAGGLALVQDPSTAEFGGMPKSAIATGIVAEILSPTELARLVFQYLAASADLAPTVNQNAQIDSDSLNRIAELLMAETGLDFSQYKTSTISRRVWRRCKINHIFNLEEYICLLNSSAAEREVLCSDLLINVTRFFRDRQAWQQLERVIAQIVTRDRANGEIRFWVTACSTGEEAYSLAILVYEAIQNLGQNLQVKIFATDIDRAALKIASQGVYSTSIIEDLDRDRLQKYFVVRDGLFQIDKKIRQMLIFSPHDLTKDAGFTRIDLITCRNVAIYMKPKLQEQIWRNFHFALVKQGVLFLGEAEDLGSFASEFIVLDRKWKLFQKRRNLQLTIPFRNLAEVSRVEPYIERDKLRRQRFEPILEQCLNRLSRSADWIILIVSQNGLLLHVSGDSSKIFKTLDGKVTNEIGKTIVEPLQLPLSTALYRARKTGEKIELSKIELEDCGKILNLTLEVLPPEPDLGHRTFSIAIFKPIAVKAIAPLDNGRAFESDRETAQYITELEQELEQARQNLQALAEELETTNEEQQVANEELSASNEELQSTNEELHTVNAEYQAKILELTQLNDDIDNLLKSTEIGVIFLDAKLQIRRFTPAVTIAIAVRPSDIFRPITELQWKFKCSNLVELLGEVLATQQGIEVEVKLKGAEHYLLMQIRPYQTQNSKSEGLVVSFIQIDEIKQVQLNLEQEIVARQRSEAELSVAQQHIESIFSSLEDAVWSFDLANRTLGYINDSFITIYGSSKAELKANPNLWLEAIHSEDRAEVEAAHQSVTQHIDLEYRIIHRDGSMRWIRERRKVICDDRGLPIRHDFVINDLTTQKQVQQALKEREQSFQAIFNSMFQFIGVLSPDGILLEANQTALAFAGVTPEEVLDRPFWLAKWWRISESTQLQLQEAIARAAAGEFVRYEVDVLGTEDRIATIDFSLNPIVDESGRVVQIIPEGRDISELKQIREDLWQANLELEQRVAERTNSLAQYSDRLEQLHSLAACDHQTQAELLADYLETGCKILNMSVGIVGRVESNIYRVIAAQNSDLNIGVGDLIPYADTYCAEVIQTQNTVALTEVGQIEAMQNHPLYQNFKLESYIGTPILVDGKLFGTLNFSDPDPRTSPFTRGEIKIVELMARDIGQAITTLEVKQALEQSEVRFRNTFEQAATGVVHVSPTGKFLQVNQRFCQILDYPDGFPSDLTFQEITHPDDLELDLHYFQQMLVEEINSYSIEKRYIKHDRSIVWVNITVSLIKDSLGQPDYFVAVIEDISARKATEFALEQSRIKLQQANQAKDNFIAHMSHELRTPLNSVIGFSHILLQDRTLTPEQLKSVEIVNQSGQHLLTLINDVLDLSKQNANKLELKYYDLDLIQFLGDISDIFRTRAREKNIVFQTHISNDLPTVINTDETKLRQVLFNILSNALKFTRQGSVTLSVNSLDAAAELHQIRFEVKDTGRGIPHDKFDAVFTPFEQIDRDLHDSEGTGLGLSICQNILQLMESQLHLTSEVGRGSCFWFDLAVREVGYCSSIQEDSTPQSTFKLTVPCKALVVDDNQDNRILLVQFLESLGFYVREAQDGREAIAIAEQFLPDIILTDLLMPNLNGKETIDLIRQHDRLKDTIILLVSANLQSIMDSSDIQCDGFLAKPIVLQELIEILDKHLATKQPKSCSNSEILITPEQSELIELLELVNFGDMENLLQQASFLADQNTEYSSFIEQIRQLAANCQQDELEQLLERALLEKTER